MKTPKIIFQDNHILIINKPSGLVINRAESVKAKTLQDWIENYLSAQSELKRSGIVHRIDKDTSGVLIIAKTPSAFINLQAQFKKRQVQKEYFALVHGRLTPKKGNINLPIKRNPRNRRKFTVRLRGKKSLTYYRVQKYYSKFTMLKAMPKTGRTHQIRVHLKHIKHPIVADPLYLGEKRLQKDSKWCPRLFLHAHKISFIHPQKQGRVEYQSNLPDKLKKSLKTLKNEKNI